MNAIQDFALLFAIAVPVLLIVGINLFLALGGERGTLLLPSALVFPSLDIPAEPAKTAVEANTINAAAANDALEREAA